jgi:hypothetical protein
MPLPPRHFRSIPARAPIEQIGHFRSDLKYEAAVELQHLRGVERRFRQITLLQDEIVALTKTSTSDKRTVGGDDE